MNFSDPEVDPEGLYPVDLVVRGRRWVGVSIVSSDADANNAALSKLKHARSPIFERHRALWAVVPRDIEALTQISRRRIINEFLSLTSEWTEPARGDVVGRLRDLAEPEQPLH